MSEENKNIEKEIKRLESRKTEDDLFVKLAKDYLLEKERESYFFAFDTKDLLKVDMEKRYRAYEIASRKGFMQIDEIRTLENLAPLGLDFVKLGLQDVLLDVDTGDIYTPNTNQLTSLKGGEGGNENRDQK